MRFAVAGEGDHRRLRKRSLVALAFAILLATGCAKVPRDETSQLERITLAEGWLAMGTSFAVDLRLRENEIPRAKTWLAWARTELARLEAIYSRHDDASQLSNLNRTLANGAMVEGGAEISPALEAVLVDSVDVWEATGGAFDVTVGPLVEVWRRAAERGAWPTVETLREAKERVGSERLRLPGGGRLVVTANRVRIDLDAVSKGAALDHIGEAFARALPDAAALLTFGPTSTLAIGDPDGGGWIVVVKSSDASAGELATLRLRDRAVSVSSSVGIVSEIAGQPVSHIIDPRTGSTVEGTVEAVVIGDRSLRADGWSTGLLVLGAQRSTIRLVEKAGLEAYVFDSSGRTVSSAGWEAHLAQTAR